MKKQINALELHYLLKELKILIDGKIDKIYQSDKKEFLFVFHLPGKGKKILRAALPNFLYLTEEKGDTPEKPTGFCVFLRKHLTNARLRSISQKGFERVVEFTFEKKESKLHLIIELFSTGNIILTDDKYHIMVPLEVQRWKDRTIKPKEQYKFPEREHNFLKISLKELKKLIEESEKDSLAVVLAVDLGLGGTYAEELCLMAGIDKKNKKLDDKETENIFKAVSELRNKKINPCIYHKDGAVEDIAPFELLRYKALRCETSKSFSKALDSVLSVQIKEESRKDSAHSKKVEELKRIIEKQELRVKEIEQSISDNKRKGEQIYENYQKIDALLKEIIKLREKHGWTEVQLILKKKNIELNTKDKTITFEL